jgi:hypothetical protein
MSHATPVVVGFQVVGKPGASGAAPALSRVFVVRTAAEEFLRLVLPQLPDAYIQNCHAFEDDGRGGTIKRGRRA